MLERFFDIIFSLFALLVFSPILIIVSILLKIMGNDILYRQQRVGQGGTFFDVYKFTTMVRDSEQMGTGTITLKNDERVLSIGKFLRKSKLNELPQLLNILKGDMSLIGPRPQDKKGFAAFNKLEQKKIIKVKPGLSGIGSIFFRDEEEMMERTKEEDKNAFYVEIISPYKGEIEAWYVEHKSLYFYFLLIFMTLYVVFCPKNTLDYSKIFKEFPQVPKELAEVL